jgi:hypothetical protein
LSCHRSQVFDWLPYNRGALDRMPQDPIQQRSWLCDWYVSEVAPPADRYRDLLVATYGPQRGPQVKYLEAFELCEYGAPLPAEKRRELFPFLP